MDILVALLVAAAFAAVFRKPLKRFPAVFYAVALALDALLVVGQLFDVPAALWGAVLTFHARCLPAFALFAVVMFTGVLRDGSRVKAALLPVRGELSVLASILAAGHAANFASLLVGRFAANGLNAATAFLAVAVLMVVLLVPLAVTSLRLVKRRMSSSAWRRLQRFAYVFWALVFVHVLLVLGPSAAGGAASACESIAAYAAVFVLYLVLRVRRFALGRAHMGAKAQEHA